MKRRLLSILLLCCMVLTLPLGMAAAEETAGTATEVKTSKELTAALEGTAETVRLEANITITTEDSLTVRRTVTLDLNGCVLEKAGYGSVIKVESGGNLTLTDSNTTVEHKFKPDQYGVWELDETTGTKTVKGGVIAGGTGTDGCGGGVYVAGGGKFTMEGGSIAGCAVRTTTGYALGGGVYVANRGTFNMTGGSIENCKASADGSSAFGGGIYNAGRTTLSGTAKIRNCQAANAGGGIYDYSILNISDNVEIEITSCTAPLWSAMVASGTISGGTFNGTVTSGGRITGGTFNGEVRNVGTITGGTFNGQVTNPGRITGGTFKGGITGTPALATGSGTETDPYQIGTAIGLKWFRDKVNAAKKIGDTKICAELTADIVLDATENWTPIGKELSAGVGQFPYTGTFDGKGHTIKNLNVNSETFAGLFGYVHGGTIRNLTVSGSVKGQQHAGGIAGGADGGTFESCANLCDVQGGIAGGIIGLATSQDNNLIVRDCYNAGKITSTTGNSVGGIIGQCTGTQYSTISNCYNAGKVTGSDGVGAIAGNDGSKAISNCYYLEGSVNQAGYGDKKSYPKTAEEFADGTVLALLKAGERGSNADPWADTCQYVTAAKMTLPVFKGQGDAHEHSGAWTSNGDGTHTRTCACGVTEKTKCSGGTATCTAKAKCADCGAEYGDTNPNHHGDKLKHVEAKDATTSEEGNIEYWYCEACEKYFSDADARNEITQAQTVIPKRQSSGSNYSYYTIKATAGAGGSLSPSGNVSVREGRDQIFTITPDKGYAVSNVKIDGKSIGAVRSYTFENVRQSHTIEVSFAEIAFADVPAGSYYEDAVIWAVENGITQGTDAAHFSPHGICTRGQAVTFLWRAAGSPAPKASTMPFTDVKPGSYCYEAVLWAVENGIAKGTTETTFSPDAHCTRAQTAAFLYRYVQTQGKGFTGAWMFRLPFTDVPEWAYEPVAWCCMNGVTKGTTDTTFSPNAPCTRAQIVTFLWRAMQ